MGDLKKSDFFIGLGESFLRKKCLILFYFFFSVWVFFCRDLERRNKIVSFCSLASELIFFFVFVFYFVFWCFKWQKIEIFVWNFFSQNVFECRFLNFFSFSHSPFLVIVDLFSSSPDKKVEKKKKKITENKVLKTHILFIYHCCFHLVDIPFFSLSFV